MGCLLSCRLTTPKNMHPMVAGLERRSRLFMEHKQVIILKDRRNLEWNLERSYNC